MHVRLCPPSFRFPPRDQHTHIRYGFRKGNGCLHDYFSDPSDSSIRLRTMNEKKKKKLMSTRLISFQVLCDLRKCLSPESAACQETGLCTNLSVQILELLLAQRLLQASPPPAAATTPAAATAAATAAVAAAVAAAEAAAKATPNDKALIQISGERWHCLPKKRDIMEVSGHQAPQVKTRIVNYGFDDR